MVMSQSSLGSDALRILSHRKDVFIAPHAQQRSGNRCFQQLLRLRAWRTCDQGLSQESEFHFASRADGRMHHASGQQVSQRISTCDDAHECLQGANIV